MPSPTITTTQLAEHNTVQDLWIAVHGKVYDLTQFAKHHPGGIDALHEQAGADGTEAYEYAGHSTSAVDTLKRFEVGSLEGQKKQAKDEASTKPRMPAAKLIASASASTTVKESSSTRQVAYFVVAVIAFLLFARWANSGVEMNYHERYAAPGRAFATTVLAVTLLALVSTAILIPRVIKAFSVHGREVFDYPSVIRVEQHR